MKKLLITFFLIFLSPGAFAQDMAGARGIAPLETNAREAVLVEAATGDTLLAKDADTSMPTSSMSKVMTMYLVFDAIRQGKLKMDDELTVSEHAWKQEGSRMFLNAGDKVRVEDLVRGVIVQSGNDAAVVLAEALGGSEPQFAEMMNSKAKELGLTHSHFTNATGLPDPDHYSTARDLAKLALVMIRDFPEDYKYYSEKDFTYNNIKQGNRNPLLYRNIGVDGLKTGHTEAAGFGLIASMVRDGRRLILVVNGLTNMQERADEPAKILEWGYREFGLYPITKEGGQMAEARVWLGTAPAVPLVAGENVSLSLPRSARAGLKVTVAYDQPIPAPVQKGQAAGKVTITAPGKETVEVLLVAGENVGQLGLFDRMLAKLKFLMGKG
ncbi:MAG: D-alanyl-D-alanine carboxypeptidase [Alphaproteobacteria bacterium]|nr:D-alanyl-D-alanine carboxypeptidase [Alphaproteobacteria bacterium]